MPKIIVCGNEKGGSGKSTTAAHMLVFLCYCGYRVAGIDVDNRQKSLKTFFDHRVHFSKANNVAIKTPKILRLKSSDADSNRIARKEDATLLLTAIEELSEKADYILIDCPGSHSNMSLVAHTKADILITPVNDSFVDLAVIANIDFKTNTILSPSVYSEMVWSSRLLRSEEGLPAIDWIIIRNRVPHISSRNKKNIEVSLTKMSNRFGFRWVNGFSERVIYRELFLLGLTTFDLKHINGWTLTMSQIAARAEVRGLIEALKLRNVKIGNSSLAQ